MLGLFFISILASAVASGPGDGLSKTTYSCNGPLTGLAFNMKYFPVTDAEDSCSNDVCTCVISGQDYTVEQGRVALIQATAAAALGLVAAPTLPTSTEGFGLHLVNCSTNAQPGGMTTPEVEQEFATKVGDMTRYDSFMDYNVALLTSNLDSYATAFDKDEVSYLPLHWDDQGDSYYGILVLVPDSQMIIEVMALNSSLTSHVASHPRLLHMDEPRASRAALARAHARLAASTDILTAINIGRAASNMSAIDEFYSNGMQTETTLSIDTASYSKRCYLWTKQGATADVCFTQRPDSDTLGSFKVSDFESMLNTVHANVVTSDNCWNKWSDNHYAVDTPETITTSMDYIITYIESKASTIYYYCQSGVLHYISDPTGWGIQLDLTFTSSASTKLCSSQAVGGPPPPPPTDDHSGPGTDDSSGEICPCTMMTQCGVYGP